VRTGGDHHITAHDCLLLPGEPGEEGSATSGSADLC
jgi:hypothetical protein